MAAAIEFDLLFQVVWVSMLAGVGITTLFSLLIYGTARAAESRREGRSAATAAFGALAVLAGVGFAALVVFGVAIIVAD